MVEPGVVNLDVTTRGRPARALLRARSVEPVDLHDWRQRRVQLRRRALLPPRHDGQPRARAQGGPAGRRSRAAGRRQRRSTSDRIWPGCSWGPRGCSASPWRSRCGCCRGRRRISTLLAGYASLAGGGRRGLADRRVRACCPARWRSWTAWRSTRRKRRSTPATRPALPPSCSSSSKATPSRSTPRSTRLTRIVQASGATSTRTASDAGRPRAHLEGAQVRVLRGRPPQSRFHRAGRRRAAHAARRGARAAFSGLAAEHGIRVANVFHAGDGNLHPLILFDGREPGALERAELLAADILRMCIRARRLDHRRARRRPGEARVPGRDVRRPTIWRSCSGCAPRSIRTGIANRGKMLGTAEQRPTGARPASARARRRDLAGMTLQPATVDGTAGRGARADAAVTGARGGDQGSADRRARRRGRSTCRRPERHRSSIRPTSASSPRSPGTPLSRDRRRAGRARAVPAVRSAAGRRPAPPSAAPSPPG